MRYRLHLSAWDFMDRVHVSMSLVDDQEDSSPRVLEVSVDPEGVGESDPWVWARDALVAALEAL